MASTQTTTEQIIETNPEDIDAILSKELFQLSLTDRNAIDEEIHGVSNLAPKESPEFLENALRELAEEVGRIPDDSPSKAAYLESQILPETHVNQTDFRLRFLRSELFDAQKAAIRMLNFLDFTSDLYGPVVLKRPMSILDFTNDEKKLMKVGNVQILPYRERSGRPIITLVGDFGFRQGTPQMRYKIFLYYFYILSNDVESQRKGVTKITWVGSNNFDVARIGWESVYLKRMMEAIPLRVGVSHVCLPDKTYCHVLRAAYGLALGSTLPRIKFHIGEEVELLYTLKTFGIPVDLIPVTGTGNVKTLFIKQWIQTRTLIEEGSFKGDRDSIIDYPGFHDVIFQRGKSLLCHPGNYDFQGIIESNLEQHVLAGNWEKKQIVKAIMNEVKQEGGRFLAWDTKGWWTELNATEAHGKVATLMKESKKKRFCRDQKQQQKSRSSTFVFQNQDNAKRRKVTPPHTDAYNADGTCDCSLFSLPVHNVGEWCR